MFPWGCMDEYMLYTLYLEWMQEGDLSLCVPLGVEEYMLYSVHTVCWMNAGRRFIFVCSPGGGKRRTGMPQVWPFLSWTNQKNQYPTIGAEKLEPNVLRRFLELNAAVTKNSEACFIRVHTERICCRYRSPKQSMMVWGLLFTLWLLVKLDVTRISNSGPLTH